MPYYGLAQYYVSDTAWSNLVAAGVKNGHISAASERARGMYAYLEYLSTLPINSWSDTRPLNVKNLDSTRLDSGRLPFWQAEYHRRMRALTLTEPTKSYLITLAEMFSISNSTINIISPGSQQSAVIEAIGLGWLSSTVLDATINSENKVLITR